MDNVYIYIILILSLIIILLLWTISGLKHVVSGAKEIKDIRNSVLSKKKEENKKKILSLLKAKKKWTNKELKKELKVTRRTIINYCDELEKKGKIVQVGKSGRDTYYKLK